MDFWRTSRSCSVDSESFRGARIANQRVWSGQDLGILVSQNVVILWGLGVTPCSRGALWSPETQHSALFGTRVKYELVTPLGGEDIADWREIAEIGTFWPQDCPGWARSATLPQILTHIYIDFRDFKNYWIKAIFLTSSTLATTIRVSLS